VPERAEIRTVHETTLGDGMVLKRRRVAERRFDFE
jgi:hypothetical protein